jgi:hypothetical protein
MAPGEMYRNSTEMMTAQHCKCVNVTKLFFFFFLRDWGLNSGPCSCKGGALLLEPQL